MEKIILTISVILFIAMGGILIYAIVEMINPPHMRRAKKRRKERDQARAKQHKSAQESEKTKKDTTYRWVPPKGSSKEKILRAEKPRKTVTSDTTYRETTTKSEPAQPWQKTYVSTEEKSEYDLLVEDLRASNNWHECYEKRWLFTRNERPQHKKITEWASQKGYIVLAKVRMGDLVNVRQDKRWSQGLWYKVSQKHLDFVICKSNLDPIIAIEIQDGSHNDLKAMETDAFKKIVLESCGYKMLQIYDVTDEILDRAISS